MEEINDNQQIPQIGVKRPLICKFFKELNTQTNQAIHKSLRKQVKESSLKSLKQAKLKTKKQMTASCINKKTQQVIRNGNRIFATWNNEQINGEAEIYYHNGVTFKGTYRNGVKICGHFKFLNGYEYQGHCFGNKFYGEGSLIFPSGKIIYGQWKEYNIIGNGKIVYPHGEVYYGQIDNFKKNGKGYLFLGDGDKYIGQFKAGLISGNGIYYVNNIPISYGLWENGELIESKNINVKDYSINDEIILQIEQQVSDRVKDKQNKIDTNKINHNSSQLKNKKVHFID